MLTRPKSQIYIAYLCWNYYISSSENRDELNLIFRIDRVERLLEKMGLKYLWKKVIRQELDLKRVLKTILDRCNDIFRQESLSKFRLLKSVSWILNYNEEWSIQNYAQGGNLKNRIGIAWYKM